MQVGIVHEVSGWVFMLMLYNCGFFVVITFAILIMHFMMPVAILEKYFKPPYFRDVECDFFSGVPYAPIRTIMFMRVIAFPASGKKRGITAANLLAPTWYRIISKIIVISIVLSFVGWLILLGGGGIVLFLSK